METIIRLFQVKKLIALMLTIAFVILSLNGSIVADSFVSVFMIVIGFYYGQSTVRHTLTDEHDQSTTE